MGCLVRLGIKKPTNVGFLERWYPVGDCSLFSFEVLKNKFKKPMRNFYTEQLVT